MIKEWRVVQWKDKMSGRMRDSWDVYCGEELLAGDLFKSEAEKLVAAHNASLKEIEE